MFIIRFVEKHDNATIHCAKTSSLYAAIRLYNCLWKGGECKRISIENNEGAELQSYSLPEEGKPERVA